MLNVIVRVKASPELANVDHDRNVEEAREVFAHCHEGLGSLYLVLANESACGLCPGTGRVYDRLGNWVDRSPSSTEQAHDHVLCRARDSIRLLNLYQLEAEEHTDPQKEPICLDLHRLPNVHQRRSCRPSFHGVEGEAKDAPFGARLSESDVHHLQDVRRLQREQDVNRSARKYFCCCPRPLQIF